MKRTDLLDTSIEMHRIRIRLQRQRTPAQRLQKTLELCDELRAIRESTKQYRAREPR